MKAIFKTKSNFRNTNYKELTVVEIFATRVTALVPDDVNEFVKVDFTLSEVVTFTQGVTVAPTNILYNYPNS